MSSPVTDFFLKSLPKTGQFFPVLEGIVKGVVFTMSHLQNLPELDPILTLTLIHI